MRNLASSTDHYRTVLGFDPDPIEAPGSSILSWDGVRLVPGECPDEVDAAETGNRSWFLHVLVKGVDELHREVLSPDIPLPPKGFHPPE